MSLSVLPKYAYARSQSWSLVEGVWYTCSHTESVNLVQRGTYQVSSNDKERRIRPKPLILNPTSTAVQSRVMVMNSHLVQKTCPPYYCHNTQQCYSTDHYGWIGSLLLNDWVPNVELNPILSLAGKTKEIRTSLASIVAEGHETVTGTVRAMRSLTNVIKTVQSCRKNPLKCLKKSIPSSRRDLMKTSVKKVADTYLGVNFGLLPALDDLGTLTQVLKDRLDGVDLRPIIQTVTFGDSGETSWRGFARYGYIYGRRRKSALGKAYLTLRLNSGRVTFGNPAEWVWENIPFSWAVDYVLNVGDTLSALDAFSGVDNVVGYYTIRDSWDSYCNMDGFAGLEGRDPSLQKGRSHQRIAFNNPSLTMKLLYRPTKAVKAMVNLGAVLTQIATR